MLEVQRDRLRRTGTLPKSDNTDFYWPILTKLVRLALLEAEPQSP
jgi:hypothetical protein